MHRHRILLPILLSSGASLGCAHASSHSESNTTVVEHIVPRERASSVALHLSQDAGDIVIRPGPCELVTAHLQYDGSRVEPTVVVRRRGDHVIVDIDEHQLGWQRWGRHGSQWDVCIGADLVVDIDVELGAGDLDLDLDATALHDLRVSSGAGDVVIDLMDARPHAGRGEIDLGAGDLEIRLPAGLAAKIDADVGAGDVDLEGFVRRDGAFVSPTWDGTSPHLELSADVGAGDVEATIR